MAAVAIQKQVTSQYTFVKVLALSDFTPYMFYCIILFPLMILMTLTGYGRMLEA